MGSHKPYLTANQTMRVKQHKSKTPSIGEEKIANILAANSVKFIREYYQKMYVSGGKQTLLYYDFYLPEYNLYIEFDGEHHYRPCYGKADFEKGKRFDAFKTMWCLKNNASLLRIKYNDIDNAEKLICQRIDRLCPVK